FFLDDTATLAHPPLRLHDALPIFRTDVARDQALGHYFAEPGFLRIEVSAEHCESKVAIRDHSHEALRPAHQHRADVIVRHGSSCLIGHRALGEDDHSRSTKALKRHAIASSSGNWINPQDMNV